MLAPVWPVTALHVINGLPLDPDLPLFQHPAKLGVRAASAYALARALARDVITGGRRAPSG